MAFPIHRPNIIMKVDGRKADSNRHKAVFLSKGWLLSFHVTCRGKGWIGQLFSGTEPLMFLSHACPWHCSTNSGPTDKKSWVCVLKVHMGWETLNSGGLLGGSPRETETHRRSRNES